MSKVHEYRCHLDWEGSTGQGFDRYARTHRAACPPARTPLALTSDPEFGGDPDLLNPEQLLLAAASSCQMLWLLALAADAGIDVISYIEDACAVMPEDDKPTRITEIALRPRIRIVGHADDHRVRQLIQRAHENCFIANSLKSRITIAPQIELTPPASAIDNEGGPGSAQGAGRVSPKRPMREPAFTGRVGWELRMGTLSVTQLNVGWFTAVAGYWRQGDPMDQTTRFPIPAYVIEFDSRRVLVDTGLHPGAVANPTSHYGGAPSMSLFKLEQEQSIADQLELDTITQVVITHLHFDHAGGLSLLPRDVPIVIQRREWEGAGSEESIARNFYLPIDYAEIADRVRLIDGDHDLLGDGSIRLLFTPGHTPGHQSVMVGERFVIGADVSHFASGLEDHRFPIFADDHATQARSAERLRTLRDAGAVVTPGHDPEVLRPGPMDI